MESFEILNKIEKLKKEIRSAELALLDKYNKNINKSLKVFISKKIDFFPQSMINTELERLI